MKRTILICCLIMTAFLSACSGTIWKSCPFYQPGSVWESTDGQIVLRVRTTQISVYNELLYPADCQIHLPDKTILAIATWTDMQQGYILFYPPEHEVCYAQRTNGGCEHTPGILRLSPYFSLFDSQHFAAKDVSPYKILQGGKWLQFQRVKEGIQQ